MTMRSVCWLLLAFCCSAGAAPLGCPYPSSVKYAAGYFQVAGEPLRWKSQKVLPVDYIDTFVGAVFTPGKDAERKQGYMEKCVYRSGSGQLVTLRYQASAALESMSLTDTTHWRLASDSLGQAVYQCDDTQPDNCSFVLNFAGPH